MVVNKEVYKKAEELWNETCKTMIKMEDFIKFKDKVREFLNDNILIPYSTSKGVRKAMMEIKKRIKDEIK